MEGAPRVAKLLNSLELNPPSRASPSRSYIGLLIDSCDNLVFCGSSESEPSRALPGGGVTLFEFFPEGAASREQRHGSSSSSEDRSDCFPRDAALVISPRRMQTMKVVRMHIL